MLPLPLRGPGHIACGCPKLCGGVLEIPAFIVILEHKFYTILRFLFSDKPYTAGNSWLLLAVRIIFGGLLMSHGIAKWQNFDALSAAFPDPLGVGGGVSLALAIFGEVVCSVGFIAGLFYRLALIPMIFTMCVAFFAVHGGDPFAARELALAYLSVYVLMYAAGPGLYAADTLIARRLPKPRR